MMDQLLSTFTCGTEDATPESFFADHTALVHEYRLRIARRAKRAAAYFGVAVKARLAACPRGPERLVPMYMPMVIVRQQTTYTEMGWKKRTKHRSYGDKRYQWEAVTGVSCKELLELLSANVDPMFHDIVHEVEREFEACRTAARLLRTVSYALNGQRHILRAPVVPARAEELPAA